MYRNAVIAIANENMKPRKPIAEREAGYLYCHGLRAAKIALDLADAVDEAGAVDRDVLFAGALFHDVAKGQKPHARIGAEMIRTLLAPVCTPAELGAVADLVRRHNKRGDVDTTALKLLQDADTLDHVGAQQVWMTFQWVAYHEQSQKDALAWIRGEQNRYWLDTLRERLHFDISRERFAQRVALSEAFFEALEREQGWPLGVAMTR